MTGSDQGDEALKERMNQRLNQLHWSLVDLAETTGESYRNVHRWIREDVKVPAHFISRFVEVVPVSSRWLLTGDGTPDPVKESTAKRALERIAHVLDAVRLTSSTGVLAESVIQSSLDGIFAFDREGRFTLWNPAMERITGLSAAAVLGETAWEILPFLGEEGEDEYFHAALRGEEAITEDRRYHFPESGRSGWFEGHYSPLRDGSGEILGGLCVLRDVTVRKEAHDRVRESEERWRRLVELSPEAVIVQVDDEVVYANEAMAELLGYSDAGELRSLPIRRLIPEDQWEWRQSVIREIEEGCRTGPLERTLLSRDGRAVEVVVRASGVSLEGRHGTQAVVSRR